MQSGKEAEKTVAASCPKIAAGLLLSLLVAAPVAAVGPYFENERAPGDRTAGPAPDFQRQEVPPKLPKVNRLVKGELLKIEDFIYVVRDPVAGTTVEMKVDRNTRMEVKPRVGDKIEAELLPNGNAWSIKTVP
jgi:hypothetical protein